MHALWLAERFRAEEHRDEIKEFLAREAPQVRRTVALLDLFGASGRMAKCWAAQGFEVASFDIKRCCTEGRSGILWSHGSQFCFFFNFHNSYQSSIIIIHHWEFF